MLNCVLHMCVCGGGSSGGTSVLNCVLHMCVCGGGRGSSGGTVC